MNKYVRKLFGVMFQSQQTQRIVHIQAQHAPTSPEEWRRHWQSLGQTWRTEPEIDAKRQGELSRHRSIIPDIEKGIYPFKGIKLSRADVEWLLAMHENGQRQADWNDWRQPGPEGLDLRGADLREAHLEGAHFRGVHLEGAILRGAHLEGASLRNAHLEGSDLRGAFFTNATNLAGIFLGNEKFGFASLRGVRWGDVELSVVDWTQVKILGDERQARQRMRDNGEMKTATIRLEEYLEAVRANRKRAWISSKRQLCHLGTL